MANESSTLTTSESRDERANAVHANVWVVAANDRECEHPSENLRYEGDDGMNTYYRCTACDAVLISEAELLVRASNVR